MRKVDIVIKIFDIIKSSFKKKINKKKNDYLQKLFEKNPATGNYVIQVALEKYTDVFNDWDHAPFKKRDMDPELARFLEECFDEIPEEEGVDICFYLPTECRDVKREEVLISNIKTYYSFYLHQESKYLKKRYSKMVNYILISFALLVFSIVILTLSGDDIVTTAISQGINIGGWVFLWEAISIFFFKRHDTVESIKKYKRFLESLIYFKYGSDILSS